MAADDDPQGVGPGRSDGSLGGWPDVAVPDDLRELAADIETYRAEQRAAARRVARARRRARAHPLWRWAIPREHPIAEGFRAPGPRRLLLPAVISGCALLLFALVTVLLTTLAPRSVLGTRQPAPLATGKGVYPGSPGGVLPDIDVQAGSGARVAVRSLRPGLLVVLPARCACQDLVGHLAEAGQAQSLHTAVVAADTGTFSEALAVTGVTSYTDPAGRLRTALDQPAAGTFVVIVEPDGQVDDLVRGPHLVTEVADRVQQLFATR